MILIVLSVLFVCFRSKLKNYQELLLKLDHNDYSTVQCVSWFIKTKLGIQTRPNQTAEYVKQAPARQSILMSFWIPCINTGNTQGYIQTHAQCNTGVNDDSTRDSTAFRFVLLRPTESFRILISTVKYFPTFVSYRKSGQLIIYPILRS